MKKVRIILVIMMSVFFCISCNKIKETNIVSSEKRNNYEKTSERMEVQVLFKLLGVKESDVSISENLTFEKQRSENNTVSYELEIEGDEERSGYYCMEMWEDDGNSNIRVAKALTQKENEQLGFHVETDSKTCKVLYSGPLDQITSLKDRKKLVSTSIDTSHVKDYKETMTDTKKIRGAHYGYINKDGNFTVDYVDEEINESSAWKQGIFKDGKWEISSFPISIIETKEKTGIEYLNYFGYKDDNLWYFGEKKIQVTNKKGDVLAYMNISKWKKNKGMEIKKLQSIVPFTKLRCIINLTDKEGNAEAYLVNLKNKKIIRKYKTHMNGLLEGNYQINCDGDLCEIKNGKSGEIVKKIDISPIRNDFLKENTCVDY